MEHRALALEYRPQRFDEVTGQHHVTAVLSRALAHGRIHHAYLFSGPRGVGKTTTARILAKVLNCPNVTDGAPCNQCDTCRDITAGVALDVQEIDGASNRGIADVQQLREKVRFAPTGGRYKVIIIDEVHQLSGDAFAALLKTLEEPPAHAVFVFATTDPLKLPDTIRSRCQRYDFGRLPLPAIVERLKQITTRESARGETVEVTDEAAFLLARKSEGSMRDAVSALDQILATGVTRVDEAAVDEVLGLVSREVFFALGGRILAREPEGSLAALHAAYRDGADPRDLAEGLLEHLRGILVLRVDPAAEDLLAASSGEKERFLAQGEGHDTTDLLRLMRVVSEAMGAMRDSAQPLTHLEAAVVEMACLEPGVRLAEILDRLGVIESGGSGGGSGESARPRSAPAGTPAAAPRTPEPAPRRRAPTTPYRKGTDVYGPDPHLASAAGVPETPIVAGVPDGPVAAGVPETPIVAGAPEPAMATAVLEGEARWDSPEAWEQVVSRVKDRKLMVGVFLAESRRMGWDGATLCLAADEVHQSLLEARENRDLLAEVLNAVYGRRVTVRFVRKEVGNGAGAPSAAAAVPAPTATAAVSAGPASDAPRVTVARPSPPAARAPEAAPSATEAAPPAPDAAEAAGEPPLSPEVREAMVWFEGEIVRRADSGGVAP
jgi:DNA polymerase-3 subunit gamma/tau